MWTTFSEVQLRNEVVARQQVGTIIAISDRETHIRLTILGPNGEFTITGHHDESIKVTDDNSD